MGTNDLRMTVPVLAVLGTMLEDPTDPWYGLELAERVTLKTGTVYPVLARLEQAGWLTSHWENVDPSDEGRPRRRLYELTGQGQAAARAAVDAHLRQMHSLTAEKRSRPRARLA